MSKIEQKELKVETLGKIENKESSNRDESREQKKKLRRAAIENMGPLHLDPKYKRPGFRQRLVNVTPGNIAKRELEGYTPIIVSKEQYGNGTVDTAHGTGGCLEVEAGRRSSLKAIWMEISEEDALILDEIRDDKAREQENMILRSEIPEDVRVGKITKEV